MLGRYELAGRGFEVSSVKLVVGLLIALFAVVELLPARGATAPGPSPSLALGGLVSGFFGGLSGHQGALRSAFLVRSGLGKEAFIGTGVACAVLVDLARLFVYGLSFLGPALSGRSGGPPPGLVAAATLSAFAGAAIGVRLIRKVTLQGMRRLVGLLLVLVGVGLAAGLL